MWLALFLGINWIVIQIHDDKDVKLFSYNFIDIVLTTGWSVEESKKYNLVLKIAISNTKSHFLFIAFSNSHYVIGIGQV